MFQQDTFELTILLPGTYKGLHWPSTAVTMDKLSFRKADLR